MLNTKKIQALQDEWETWASNAPNLNSENIQEFREHMVEYENRLKQAAGQFNSELREIFETIYRKYALQETAQELVDRQEMGWSELIDSVERLISELDYQISHSSDPSIDGYPLDDEIEGYPTSPIEQISLYLGDISYHMEALVSNLDSYLEWASTRPKFESEILLGLSTQAEFFKLNIKGIPFRFYGAVNDALVRDISQEIVPLYARRLKEVAPTFLKYHAPIYVHFQGSFVRDPSSTKGVYSNHFKVINIGAIMFEDNVKDAIHTMAHEQGHHIWNNILRKDAKDFWVSVIEGSYITLDLQNAYMTWVTMRQDEDTLKEKDPITYLQLEGLTFDEDYQDNEIYSINDVFRAYKSKEIPRKVKVMMPPITGYAKANPEEAFCEALGMLITYGPKTVHPKVRQLLRAVLPNQIKTSSHRRRKRISHPQTWDTL
jgi:hypothetical protein